MNRALVTILLGASAWALLLAPVLLALALS